MASITLTIPNALVPTLVAAADELLDARKIDRTTMTATQRAQRYVAEVLRDVYISRTRNAAQTTEQTTVDAAVTTATTDAAGIA